MFLTNLDSSYVALKPPDGAAASIKLGLGLRLGWHGPEAHTDPQSLHYLLDERGACIWKSLGHQTHRQVKSQGQRLEVLGREGKDEEKTQRVNKKLEHKQRETENWRHFEK